MDDIIRRIQSIFADSMQTLPLLLSGLLFFIGTLTANTGMLLMIVTIVMGVSGLGFVLNLKPYTQQDPLMIGRLLFTLGLLAYLRFSTPYLKNQEGASKDIALGLAVGSYIIHAIYTIGFGNITGQEETAGQCTILGQKKGQEEEFSNPSLWLISITYIIGFIFANAMSVFNLPTPSVTEGSFPDKKQRQQQQKLVDDRVTNRKMQTAFVMLACILVFIFVVSYRLNNTKCEQPYFALICPLAFVIFTSFFLYNSIILECGVRAPDILGITYDMVHPDLVNNPIVCTVN